MSENLLHRETSPYLLQHANNPVHWQPWGPVALERAATENKPVMLSIGYAACHWCHIMAHESFEDPAIAGILNADFISIKVDREERPDIDTIYQHALRFLGQQGGWPLTMFLTPKGEPFWGGTYFPPNSNFGRPSFPDVLAGILAHYRDMSDAVQQNVEQLRQALATMARAEAGGTIRLEMIDSAAERLVQEFDRDNGGIGGAPKFPNPSILELLWRAATRTGSRKLHHAVTLTLDRMSQGGIYDHLGGGYARYSTDDKWLVPHFEKMLCDNAQIMDLLTWAWMDTESPLYAARVEETAEWVVREMITDGGGFAATLDADSEGEEGRFYVWSADEIADALGEDAEFFSSAYGVTDAGNWEGKTILNRGHRPEWAEAADEARLARCREVLMKLRNRRVRPGWDDKVLADWNGLMIAAMANAGAAFERPDWTNIAIHAFDFIHGTMNPDGRLVHCRRLGRAGPMATLDDYANMVRAALTLVEHTGEARFAAAAEGWVAALDAHYLDGTAGGYYFTADDADALIVRTKSANDDATPAGNGVMAASLARLYHMTGNQDYLRGAERATAAFAGEVNGNFFPLATLLNAAEMIARPVQAVIAGPLDDPQTGALARAVRKAHGPGAMVSIIAPDANLPAHHPAYGKGPHRGKPTAYICIGRTCSLPLTGADEVAQSAEGGSPRKRARR